MCFGRFVGTRNPLGLLVCLLQKVIFRKLKWVNRDCSSALIPNLDFV